MSEPTAPRPAPSWFGDPFLSRGSVTLTAAATVNGVEITYRASLPTDQWDEIASDPAWREGYERSLLAHLGQAIVEHMKPTITVQEPPAPDAPGLAAQAHTDDARRRFVGRSN